MSFLLENPLYLFLLIIVGGCVAGLFAWAKFGSSISNKLKGPETADVLLLGKSPKIEQAKLFVDNVFYLSNDKTEEAWSFHPRSIQYDQTGGTAGVVLTHDTCLPQFPQGIDMTRMYESLKASIRPITLSMFHKAVETEIVKNANSAMGDWLGFTALVAVGGVFAVVGIILVKSMM